MDDQSKKEAGKLAARAAAQAKNAAKNSGRAAAEAAEGVAEPIMDGAEAAAQTILKDVSSTSQLTKGALAFVTAGVFLFLGYRELKAGRYPASAGRVAP